jgi:hypothetical protein
LPSLDSVSATSRPSGLKAGGVDAELAGQHLHRALLEGERAVEVRISHMYEVKASERESGLQFGERLMDWFAVTGVTATPS